jgi:hypothetical protein
MREAAAGDAGMGAADGCEGRCASNILVAVLFNSVSCCTTLSMSNKQQLRIMRTPSLKAAQDRLRRTLEGIDGAHTRAVANLPAGHSWRDIDELEIKRCDAAVRAHEAFKSAKTEWDAYVAAHADDEDVR